MTVSPKSTGLIVIACMAIFFGRVSAADEWPQFDCEDCRDISEHPEDARNFALNLIFGRDSSLSFGDTRFDLSDNFGNTIIVDINAEYILDPFDYRLLDDLFVVDIVIQVVLFYPDGDLLTYKFARKLLDPDGVLPVPAEAPVTPDASPPPAGSGVSPAALRRDGAVSTPGDRDQHWSDWQRAWGDWVCRPDFSQPNGSGVICGLP